MKDIKEIKKLIISNTRTKDKIEAERKERTALEEMQKKEFVDKVCKEFLKELSKLSRKHGVYIGGCGCCGSPFLYNKKGTIFADKLEYDKNRYSVEEQRETDEQDEIMTMLEETDFNETEVN